MPNRLKLGKKPFVASPRDLRLVDFVDVATVLPEAPANFGHEKGIPDYGMLGNDRYRDCTCAGACHEHMVYGHEAGRPVNFTNADALGLYTAVTGFSKDDPSTDQGAEVRQVLSYRRKHGLKDAAGKTHRIDGYLALEPGNIDHLAVAMYVFGAVGIGFAFPSYAMTQFNTGRAWTYRAGEPTPREGHYVPLVARRGGLLRCITWGQLQGMGLAFFEHYCDEAWAIYSREIIGPSGKTPEGFDRAGLDELLAKLG